MRSDSTSTSSKFRLEADLEIGVYLHEFRNAGLFHQGWYGIRVKVRAENEFKTFAVPVRVLSYLQSSDAKPVEEHLNFLVEEKKGVFQTRLFQIRYAREAVDVRTMVIFSLKLPADQDFNETSVLVEFDLLYSVECPLAPWAKPKEGESRKEREKRELQKVACQWFKLARPAQGLHEFCLLTFDEFHLVKCPVSIHTFTSGFCLPSSAALGTHNIHINTQDAEKSPLPKVLTGMLEGGNAALDRFKSHPHESDSDIAPHAHPIEAEGSEPVERDNVNLSRSNTPDTTTTTSQHSTAARASSSGSLPSGTLDSTRRSGENGRSGSGGGGGGLTVMRSSKSASKLLGRLPWAGIGKGKSGGADGLRVVLGDENIVGASGARSGEVDLESELREFLENSKEELEQSHLGRRLLQCSTLAEQVQALYSSFMGPLLSSQASLLHLLAPLKDLTPSMPGATANGLLLPPLPPPPHQSSSSPEEKSQPPDASVFKRDVFRESFGPGMLEQAKAQEAARTADTKGVVLKNGTVPAPSPPSVPPSLPVRRPPHRLTEPPTSLASSSSSTPSSSIWNMQRVVNSVDSPDSDRSDANVLVCPRALQWKVKDREGAAMRFASRCSTTDFLELLTHLNRDCQAGLVKVSTLRSRFLLAHKSAAPELIALLQARWESERGHEMSPWILSFECTLTLKDTLLLPKVAPSYGLADVLGCKPASSTARSIDDIDLEIEEPQLRSAASGGASTSEGVSTSTSGAPPAVSHHIRNWQYDMDRQQLKVQIHRRNLPKNLRIHSAAPLQDRSLVKRPQGQPVLCIYRNLCIGQDDDNVSKSMKDTPGVLRHSSRSESFGGGGEEVWPRCIANTEVMGDRPGLPSSRDSPHVLVFVHGFLGNSLDLRLVRDHLFILNPNILCLLSSANQDRTYDDLKDQGNRLAQEVVEQLRVWFNQSTSPKRVLRRLSFVGHSIGNLIIRAALADPVLQPFLPYLQTFLSISGPHLGTLYNTNPWFSSGIWFLKSMRRSPCLYQLTFTDAPKLENCFLYSLSLKKGLSHFRQILLVASPQDGYVPLHSSRITNCIAADKDGKRGAAFASMVQNLLGPIIDKNRIIVRADVHFPHSKVPTSFNSFVGRTAHLEFLESDAYLRMLLWTHREMFQ